MKKYEALGINVYACGRNVSITYYGGRQEDCPVKILFDFEEKAFKVYTEGVTQTIDDLMDERTNRNKRVADPRKARAIAEFINMFQPGKADWHYFVM